MLPERKLYMVMLWHLVNMEVAFTAKFLNSKPSWNFAAGIQIASGDWSVSSGSQMPTNLPDLQQSGSYKKVSWSNTLTQAVRTKVDGVAGSLWLPASMCRGAAMNIWAPDVSLGTCQQDCH